MIKDGKFINLEVEYGLATRYKLFFKDSLLLLPYSLAKLSKTFNSKHIKDMFPHDFVNKDNLNYVGIVPDIKFFKNITESQYNAYKSKFDNNWSLKSEAIKYCELDCKALFEAISKFAEKNFNLFKVNTSTTPTLPSVTMKTYRTGFILEGIKFAKIGSKMFDDIHKASFGGHVDMYSFITLF
uniref:Probable DNA polymerase n=1 Tax=Fomitiporia mediterranea TaxID=208960 RepID=A0A5B9RCS9_9AGAM|nr:DNA polymerase family B [Fomitiporia mediterranea]QEG57109.1 DNA polymerase family B [Fomitiporia mediterranea]